MSFGALIPFGVSVSTGEMVVVDEVPAGKECGCICPSCGTPLVARKGSEKAWHFAHRSRAVYKTTERDCEYSFFVAVRMMARQIISLDQGMPISLPPCMGRVSERGVTKSFSVTEQRTITFDEVHIEKEYLGHPVDVFGLIQGYPLILYFTHPGRDIPFGPDVFDQKVGVISVSLKDAWKILMSDMPDELPNRRYKKLLKDYISGETGNKEWINHPRYKNCYESALYDLREDLRRHKDVNMLNNMGARFQRKEVVDRMVRFRCVMCGCEWKGGEHKRPPCPNCKTNLFARIL